MILYILEWLTKNEPQLNNEDLICLPFIKQIQRNHNKAYFNPRWIQKDFIPKNKCNIEHCHNEVHSRTTSASADQIAHILKERVNAFTIGSRRQTAGLGKEHYTRMYVHLHPVLHCTSCGAKHRHRERFNRHCPCPSTVNHCLTKIYNESSNLTTSNVICTPCYKHLTSIIQEINPIKTQNASDLNQTIDANVTTLRQIIYLVKLKGENISKEEVYEMILYGVYSRQTGSFNEV